MVVNNNYSEFRIFVYSDRKGALKMGISYKKVKEIALQLGIKSDNAICRLCGIPNGTFNDWKNGNTKSLTEPNILKLANGLKVPVDCLFDEDDKELQNELTSIEQRLLDDERTLLQSYRTMTEEEKNIMRIFIKGMRNDRGN